MKTLEISQLHESFAARDLLSTVPEKRFKVCFLGATFATPNMGVSALTAGALTALLKQFPDAEITLLDYGRTPVATCTYEMSSRKVQVGNVNMRFSKKLWLKNHILVLLACALLLRLLRVQRFHMAFRRRSPCLNVIAEADVVCSVAGGDSFSDLYGMKRFFYVTLPQLLAVLMNKPLCLMPQTIGPFNSAIARALAKYIMRHSLAVYSRDWEGVESARALLPAAQAEKVAFCYDMGFVVEPKLVHVLGGQAAASPLVGINVSGLLLNQKSPGFGLRDDYGALIRQVVRLFMDGKKTRVVLVPHVFGSGSDSQSDALACEQVYRELQAEYPRQLSMLSGEFDEGQLKYLIGRCEFFVGSRMHACIAALSQGIPAVGIAYSRKFAGVLRSIAAEELVADACSLSAEQILNAISDAYEQRARLKARLSSRMPQVRATVLDLFPNIRCSLRQATA